MPQIFIASDHRGFEKKSQLIPQILNTLPSYDLSDLGPSSLNPEDDYNTSAKAVSQSVLAHPDSFGVLLCGSAIGMNIQANRFKGIRSFACYSEKLAQLSRLHNDANIICLPADFLDIESMMNCLQIFLSTSPLQDAKYARRNQLLDEV